MSMNLERTNRRGFLKTAGGLAAAGAAGALGLRAGARVAKSYTAQQRRS
ncbi:twin-arginine translocation signal domain-containing protein [Nonomuraea sp. SYSU D8015]